MYGGEVAEREDAEERGLAAGAVADDDQLPVSARLEWREGVLWECRAVPPHHRVVLLCHLRLPPARRYTERDLAKAPMACSTEKGFQWMR